MKKKLTSLFLIISCALIFTLTSCGRGDVLLFLNWGEYIDEELIEAFEEEYNVTVNMDLGDSNEIFYSKVKSGTTVYDVVCPSDYMVEKMYMNDMLERIDFSKLTLSEYNPDSLDVRVGVKSIFNDMNNNLKMNLGESYTDGDIKNYCVPYLWGTWGIM
jgi:spermidine/putrescine-binding protein